MAARGRKGGAESGGDRPYRVGISGSYGGLNLGDEAILQSMLTQLRESLPVDVTIFSRDPEDTFRRHRPERAVAVRTLGRREVEEHVRGLDLMVLGGGGILFDAEVRLYLRELRLAQELGVSTMIYAVGAGPLEDAEAARFVRECLAAVDVVTVRDPGARKLLEDVGVEREIEVTADPALLLRPEPLPEGILEGLRTPVGKRRIAVSVREPGGAAPDLDPDNYHQLLADAADFMVDRFGAEMVFVPMERTEREFQHCHAVMARMLRPRAATVLREDLTAGQMLELVGRFDFCVGMRLHFLIFAALRGVPFVALPYAAKVQGFLQSLDLVIPPLRLVNAGRLIAYIDTFWDGRRSMTARIRERLPELERRARRNHELAVALLRKGRAEERGDAPPAPAR